MTATNASRRTIRRMLFALLVLGAMGLGAMGLGVLIWCRCASPAPELPAGGVLRALAGTHPRIYLSRAQMPRLQEAVQGSHAGIWAPVKAWVDANVDARPPAKLEGDFRRAGELIPYAALAYRLADDPRYLELARRFMAGIAAQEHWGNDRDIEAAHLLYALAVGYDWLYAELGDTQRSVIREKLRVQGSRLRPFCRWVHPPLNNHTIVNLAALGTAGLALYPDRPSAEWLAFVNSQFERVLPFYGRDGMSSEGISYWSYTVEYMLKYFTAADELLGTRFLAGEWVRRAADMPLYAALPRAAWSAQNMFMNFADSPRFCWYGPHYQLFKLAALARNPQAQWLGREIQQSGFTRHHADWLALLWYDPSLAPREPGGQPLTKIFEDWDVAVMRSGWEADAVACMFKCSPIAGRQAEQVKWPVYPGSGHCHPDANSFVVFGAGQWLVADAGPTLVKKTGHHNTLLVDGAGQLGEGERWMDGWAQYLQRGQARFVYRQRGPDYEYIVGDASDIYPAKARLQTFLRHFIYLRPNVIVIIDEVAAGREASFEWLLHTPGNVAIEKGGRAVIRNGQATLQVAALAPADAKVSVRSEPTQAEDPGLDWDRLNVLSFAAPRPAAQSGFVLVLLVDDPGRAALTARLANNGALTTLDVEAGNVRRRIRLQGMNAPRPRPAILVSVE